MSGPTAYRSVFNGRDQVSVGRRGDAASLGLTDKQLQKLLVRAINDTARLTRTEADRRIRQEIAFKSAYVKERLTVGKKAGMGEAQPFARIRARDRATLLSRFVTGRGRRRGHVSGPITLTVKKGRPQKMPRNIFLFPLRGGNEGVVMRLRKGQVPRGGSPKRLYRSSANGGRSYYNLWLLYTISIEQAFRTRVDGLSKFVGETFERRFEAQLDRRR